MLDFYLIPDELPKPNSPGKLEYLAGLDHATYDRLVGKGFIDPRFDFFTDFRWEFRLVKQMYLKVVGVNTLDTDVKKLENL